MEEELKKLKKELLKTQEDLEEVRKANKAKDSYYNGVIKEKNAEIKEKDEVIDEMARYITCLDNDETICKKLYSGDLCEDKKIVCWECVKQYFEKKVKNKQDFE